MRFSPLIAYLSAKAMPPLGQYFSGLLKKPDERIAAPKGRRSWTLCGSSLQISRFFGSGMRAMMPFLDPPVAPLGGDLGSRRRCWRQTLCPVGAVLLASAKRTKEERQADGPQRRSTVP